MDGRRCDMFLCKEVIHINVNPSGCRRLGGLGLCEESIDVDLDIAKMSIWGHDGRSGVRCRNRRRRNQAKDIRYRRRQWCFFLFFFDVINSCREFFEDSRC